MMAKLIVEIPDAYEHWLHTWCKTMGMTRTDWVKEMIEAHQVVESETLMNAVRYDRVKIAVKRFLGMLAEKAQARIELRRAYYDGNGRMPVWIKSLKKT